MDSKRYKKILKAQALIKKRDQMLLTLLQHEEQKVEEKRKSLLSLIEKRPKEMSAGNLYLADRLKRSAGMAASLRGQVAYQQEVVQQSYKRYDNVREKHDELCKTEERKG